MHYPQRTENTYAQLFRQEVAMICKSAGILAAMTAPVVAAMAYILVTQAGPFVLLPALALSAFVAKRLSWFGGS